MPAAIDCAASPVNTQFAVAQDGDAVGQTLEFFHAMRDINDGQTFGLQFGDDAEEFFAFLLREDGGWLIHHDDARGGGEGAGDFDELLFGACERGNAGSGGDREVVPFENFLRLRVELAVVEQSGGLWSAPCQGKCFPLR